MKFLADESIDRQIVDRLRKDSHEILYVAEMEPGISDNTVVSTAINQHLQELENAFAVITPGTIRIRRSD